MFRPLELRVFVHTFSLILLSVLNDRKAIRPVPWEEGLPRQDVDGHRTFTCISPAYNYISVEFRKDAIVFFVFF